MSEFTMQFGIVIYVYYKLPFTLKGHKPLILYNTNKKNLFRFIG